MQEAVGIIAEYNPFHNGHLHHLREAKKTGLPAIAVISGSIMQRGEPAFLDKWRRARLAVLNGVDLVLELPCAFSLRSAEFFARGAVGLLAASGCVKYLACGVEHPDYAFPALAQAAASDAYKGLLQQALRSGMAYAAACAAALAALGHSGPVLEQPNDILALEYCKALSGCGITPLFIQRRQAEYNAAAISGSIASARAIRTAISAGHCQQAQNCVPASVWQELSHACGYDERLFWQLISYRLRMLEKSAIAACCQCSEGLENLLKQAAGCTTLAEALALCGSKRYPAARIRRLFVQLLLHRPRAAFEQSQPAYLRVLAFNDNGRALLKSMRADASLPVITKLGAAPCRGRSAAFREQLELDLAAADLLALLQGRAPHGDYLTSPYYQPAPTAQHAEPARPGASERVPATAGITSSRAADFSWIKPSSIELCSRYSSTSAYSASVTLRFSSGNSAARPQGTYWRIRLNSTCPGWKVCATQSMIFLLSATSPGKMRWRIMTPLCMMPCSSSR